MFFNGFGKNENIINVNNGEMTETFENVIYDILEFTWAFFRPKGMTFHS